MTRFQQPVQVANEAYRSIRRSHTGRGVLQDMVEWQAGTAV